ncbi:MAG: class I SAM-dependent methyltransferase [Actinomycetota bacterium]|nr:class I SAM-dependent methyltransferase [Actinomycetota bacterium]
MDREQIELWDDEAARFDDDPDHGLRDPDVRAAWRDLLTRLLPSPPARVADLGCGTGTLSVLLAGEGYAVDGIDFSTEMVRRAIAKAAGRDRVTVAVGDASDPPLDAAAYDVVLCRHVLWAMPDPAAALARWRELLRPGGRLVLIEGSWSTGAGLAADKTVAAVETNGLRAQLTMLDDPLYWGRETDDERYVVVARPE